MPGAGRAGASRGQGAGGRGGCSHGVLGWLREAGLPALLALPWLELGLLLLAGCRAAKLASCLVMQLSVRSSQHLAPRPST